MDKFLAFGGSFLQYVVIFVILVAIAVLGVFTGIALRKRKDAKELALHEDKKEESLPVKQEVASTMLSTGLYAPSR